VSEYRTLFNLKSKCAVGDAVDSHTFIFLLGWIIGVLTGLTYGIAEVMKKNH